MALDLQDVLRRLRVGVATDGAVALHEPRFAGREKDYLADCIDTGWVSYAGSYVTAFEKRLAALCGADHAIAVVNGTAALHLAFMVGGVRPGDEVIVPALTFVATANAVVHAGAIPHLADSDPLTLGIDPEKLERHLSEVAHSSSDGVVNRKTGRRIAAIVPMHCFGHPVDMDRLEAVAQRFGIPVIEDATEALGSTYKGRACGSFGLLSTLSFNGNKIVTTGGGGAVLTNDEGLACRAKHLSTTAKKPHAWAFDHDEVAWNYRMPNLNAAVGVAQLEQLPCFLEAKRALAQRWREVFAGCEGLTVFNPPAFADSNHWLTALVLDGSAKGQRDELLAASNASGLMMRPVWKLMHHLPAFADVPRMELSASEDLERRIVNIPSSAKLGMAGA